MTHEYVCGFFFDESFTHVALINKLKPKWQAGKLNGIGGSIEECDASNHQLMKRIAVAHNAMAREFEEEAGLKTEPEEWNMLGQINGPCRDNLLPEWTVYFFWMKSDRINELKSMTEEKVELVEVKRLVEHTRVIPNLQWLIPMCSDPNHKFFKAESK